MLQDAEKPLYEGCPNFTKLSAIIQLLNLKKGNEMYSCTYEAKKALKQMGSGHDGTVHHETHAIFAKQIP
ncbi:hypothetical protein L2E82_22100 [Cichorium intybus]|uniref:Uncharacterized protein n=1 Tax=Cichorium intybus TaxID=13427 RepID=A0ACB9DWJ0_CICIN|nr:hypothetical protein L2E82_22100 [Cichorium intybus]